MQPAPGVYGSSAIGHLWPGRPGRSDRPSAPRPGATILTLQARSECGPHSSSAHLQPLPLRTKSLGGWEWTNWKAALCSRGC